MNAVFVIEFVKSRFDFGSGLPDRKQSTGSILLGGVEYGFSSCVD